MSMNDHGKKCILLITPESGLSEEFQSKLNEEFFV